MNEARVRVGDVLQLQRRTVMLDPDVEYQEIGIRSFGNGIFHKEPSAALELGNKRVFRIEPGDLVISNVFAWEGAIAVASTEEAGMIGSHRFMTFVPRDDRIDTSWAAWFLRSEGGLELIRIASPGSAGRNRTLAIDRFENLEIQLPSIDEQRDVAKHLDRIANAKADLRLRTDRASELSKALGVSIAARPDLSVRGRRDSGWRTVVLADVLKLDIDQVPVEPEMAYEIAGVYSFGRGMFERASMSGSQTSYKVLHRLRAGQLVMSRLKAWEGALAIVPSELDGKFLSPEFPTFDMNLERVDQVYMGALVMSAEFWSRLKGASQGIGARRERVNAARLLEQEVELAPLVQQKEIARLLQCVSPIFTMRNSRSERIEALLPSALNEAFSGLR